MSHFSMHKKSFSHLSKMALIFSLVLSSCFPSKKYPSDKPFIIPRKYQKDKPFITKNNIEVKGGKFTKNERVAINQRLNAQLDDSSKIREEDKFFFLRYFKSPAAYDSASSGRSARNMQASMNHLGYYKAIVTYTADTIHKKRNTPPHVHMNYLVLAGNPTLIDTVRYLMRKPDLLQLAMQNPDLGQLEKGKPVTKANILGEVNRLVDLYRNNGYYKISAQELRVKGDTTTAALTTITDDIFERLRLLAESKKGQDSPTIKLAIVLLNPSDSSKTRKFFIQNIYLLPDYQPGDNANDPSLIKEVVKKKGIKKDCDSCEPVFTLICHKKNFRNSFLLRNLYLRRGDIYRQDDYFKTLNSFSKAGVWQSVNIQIVENKLIPDKIDLYIQLVPEKKYGFEAAIETSYSANSNSNNATAANAGNLLGLSGNISLLTRNLNKEAIRMTNAVRAGIEFNLKADSNKTKHLINSNELSLSNSIIIPRFTWPFNKVDRRRFLSSETFFNTNLSYIKRINLFDLQSINFAAGFDWTKKAKRLLKPNRLWVWKPLNFEFNRLFNRTAIFDSTLKANPFLRYSFNSALVAGLGLGSLSYSVLFTNPKNTNRQHAFKMNVEESGLLLGRIGLLKNYLRQFVKTNVEYTYSVSRPKSVIITRLFAGIGIPFKKDTTLPFFKQYFGGGSNSMRGWPVRGIGRGSQPLSPFGSTSFNDRTGDIQLEGNFEYRYDIAQLIPNSLALKGALFIDAGNVWNLRNSKPGGGLDSAQFKFKNLYKELGIAVGTGFRLDFNYFVLRFDLGFRVKRPDISKDDGWQLPDINFNNLFRSGVQVPDPLNPGKTKNDDRYRKWRYENFNFTIGISYPF